METSQSLTLEERQGHRLFLVFLEDVQKGYNPDLDEYLVQTCTVEERRAFWFFLNLWLKDFCAKYALSFGGRYE